MTARWFKALAVLSSLSSCLLLLGCGEERSNTSPLPRGASAVDSQYSSSIQHSLAVNRNDRLEASMQTAHEAYDHFVENDFMKAIDHPLSTFAIDVDTASYSNVRRLLRAGVRPPKGSVRIEELVNYFQYEYPVPQGDEPIAVRVDEIACPWNVNHRLMRVALQGRPSDEHHRPNANLVFLVDVSGSMASENKLPLMKRSLQLLVESLGPADRVAIVTYAGVSRVALESTSCQQSEKIMRAIEELQSGGATDGAGGIRTAYDLGVENFQKDGINRVLLCTDGDFNVGVTNQSELVDLIEEKAKLGVFLTVLGFGMGNYNDSTLEKLADHGNGSYAYIDTILEAHKVLVKEVGSTLETIAKDVKIQVDFNPNQIEAYRLIGFENRLMSDQDFRNDQKDAGEMGAGHRVTALYEIVESGSKAPEISSAASEFVKSMITDSADSAVRAVVRLRYKAPMGDSACEWTVQHDESNILDSDSSQYRDFEFASAVAGFGMLLRDSAHRGQCRWSMVQELAIAGSKDDPTGQRREFLDLIAIARNVTADDE